MKDFHILLVGVVIPIFTKTMLFVHDKYKYRISFIVQSKRDLASLYKSGISIERIYCFSEHKFKMPDSQDIAYLNSLEQEDVPTIHNMIMSDRIVNKLPYTDGIAYATYLARSFKSLYNEIRPSVVIGGHDGMLAAISSAVAKSEAIPWFSFNFSSVPPGYAALGTGIVPTSNVRLREQKEKDLDILAEKMLSNFENKQIKVPAYISAHTIRLAARRLPEQLKEAFRLSKANCFGKLNKYLEYDLKFIFKQFIRKRMNMLRLPHKWFLKEPPKFPYIFFGLQMQPESTIDVYAPFYSNQFDIIEKISRAIPPTHTLLVKIHFSDADNYSRKQLRFLLKLPGVKLVSPNASSREFIENSSLVFSITSTIGLEAALLGKPVLVFGHTLYKNFPSVTRIEDINNLPFLIRQKLSEQRPSIDSILDAFKKHLNPYFQTIFNDWTKSKISQEEITGFVELFCALEKYLSAKSVCPE